MSGLLQPDLGKPLELVNPYTFRKFGETMFLTVDLCTDDLGDIREQIRRGMYMERAVAALLSGEIDSDDFLDIAEHHLGTGVMDQYLDEACENLEFKLEHASA